MSYHYEVLIISGYKVPNEIFYEAKENFFEIAAKNPTLAFFEDYFVDTNTMTDGGDTFFGKIIREYDEDTFSEEMDKILTPIGDIPQVQFAFHALFDKFLPEDYKPKFTRWITGRWD